MKMGWYLILIAAVAVAHATSPENEMEAGPSSNDLLQAMVKNFMLSEKMTSLLARTMKTVCDQSVAEAMRRREQERGYGHRVQPWARHLEQAAETGGVVCTLEECGDSDECSALNKELDNVDNCHQCGNKKHSANEWFGPSSRFCRTLLSTRILIPAIS